MTAKAVVTSLDLDRSLAAQNLMVGADAPTVQGELRNDGLDEITIPHVFLTLRDASGEVAVLMTRSCPKRSVPNRSVPFTLRPPSPEDVEPIDRAPVRLFSNSPTVNRSVDRTPLLGSFAGWASADLVLVGFTRSS